MASAASQLILWFRERPVWIQDAVRRLHLKGTLVAIDDAELFGLCKKATSPAPALTEAMLNFKVATNKVVLKTLSEPRGIDQLNPKKTLQFDDHLTIVYGNNGCGKSGYVRILKQICGARSARQLAANVFSADEVAQSCKFVFTLNEGQDEENVWCPKDGPHGHLRAMEVYDTDGGALYTTKENEVLFEPPLLSMVQQIINAAGRIESLLDAEVRSLASQKPELPPIHLGTQAAIWYPNIKADTLDATIERQCEWIEGDQEKLDGLTMRLAETNPTEEAKKARKLIKSLQDFTTDLKGIRASIDDEHAKAIDKARSLSASTRKTATDAAQKVFGQSPLSGIGEESWKRLWEHARAYSTEVAYKDHPFPKTEADALCVLCQQTLTGEAKLRLVAFEEFVKGRVESQANAARTALDKLLDELPTPEAADTFAIKLDSLQITQEETRGTLITYYEAIRSRSVAITGNTPLPPLPAEAVISQLDDIADALEEKAKKLDEDAKAEGKEALRSEAKELSARKWLSEQKSAVVAERDRLVKVKRLEAARKLLNTKALSDKKSALTTELITDAFVARFQGELKSLGAPRLKVSIKKTGVTKGQVMHQVQLTSARAGSKTGEILSEGEQRVVSLAAFLADSEGGGATAPFIFDDPISSLDQDYEEATVKRLVTLAKKRQVIVFTHRISLLTFLEDVAESEGIKPRVMGLQKESWGTGEPSTPPLFAMKPDKVINLLLNDRVARARKVLADEGTESYSIQAKAICSEIRVVIERLVESTLLNGIVLRFRRPVNTLNKLDKLSKIKPVDCKLIDDLMKEYSKYEHSQSGEAPVAMPDPDQLEKDLRRLQVWQEEFAKRV